MQAADNEMQKKKKKEWWIIGERNGRGRGNNAGEFGRKEGLMGFDDFFVF